MPKHRLAEEVGGKKINLCPRPCTATGRFQPMVNRPGIHFLHTAPFLICLPCVPISCWFRTVKREGKRARFRREPNTVIKEYSLNCRWVGVPCRRCTDTTNEDATALRLRINHRLSCTSSFSCSSEFLVFNLKKSLDIFSREFEIGAQN